MLGNLIALLVGMTTPCYVISSNGFKDSLSYEDDWAYGKSEWLGHTTEWDETRNLIKDDIRAHFDERNGIPIYSISDHGNESRVRSIRLRRR